MVSIRKIIFPGFLPSFMKVRYYKWFKKAKIGKGTKISLFSYISAPKIVLGKKCKIGMMTFIEATKSVQLGNYVKISMQTSIRTGIIQIGDETEIMDNVRIGGILTHKSSLIIGKQVGIFPYCYINPSYEILIGDRVGIGGRSHLFTHGGWHSPLDGYPFKYAPIKIEENAWLAWRVTITPGVTVGKGAIVQADSLVTKNVPEYHYARGNPLIVSKFKIFDYNNEKKITIVQNFVGNLTSVFEEDEQKTSYLTHHKKTKYLVTYWYNNNIEDFISWMKRIDSEFKHQINILYWREVYEKLPPEFREKNRSYFIIENKKLLGNTKLNEEIKEFFKRYWINFEYQN
jgi:acetyltransferase-like isoleucine patch superfamily enzyme